MKYFLILGVLYSLVFSSIDINTASEKELSGLTGIGASKAKAIIEYRESNCFKSIYELSKVKGIGKKTIEKNLENITASECQ
jgi:competence protein ComEA